MRIDKKTAAIVVVAILLGFWWGGGTWERHPFIPVPLPTPAHDRTKDRPVLKFIFRTAKNLLWLAAFAEPPPPEQPDQRLVHAPAIGEDGYPMVDHARGL